MNDFTLALVLYPDVLVHDVTINVALTPSAGAAQRELIVGILTRFSEACAYGLLSGSNDPVKAETVRFRVGEGTGSVDCELAANGIDWRAFRVMAGMLRGEFRLNGAIASVRVNSLGVGGGKSVRAGNEMDIGLPGPYPSSGKLNVERIEIPVRTARLVRVRFVERPSAEAVDQLTHIQKIWTAVCKGGFAPLGKAAHTCFLSGPTGYLVSPRVFEIPIDMFDNTEAAFDPLLNAIDRFSVNVIRVESVIIY
jgi:hypothetical protein